MRKLQIGVMGSMADLNYTEEIRKIAEEIGYWVAKNNTTLIFGAEKDDDSLSTRACLGAKKAGGTTVGVTYGKGKDIYNPNIADIIIATGLERGGGREMTLVLSCDAIITIGGGSGTLNEIAVAYQANIPIVSIENSGGWSEKLIGNYLDSRNRIEIIGAPNAKLAVEMAIMLIQERQNKNKCGML